MDYKEIGSEFWEVPTCSTKNNIFPEETKWFISGRSALKYIIQDCNIKSVELPSWHCHTMVEPFKKSGVEVSFYEAEPKGNCEALFLIDYFGCTGQSKAPEGYSGVIIRDLTHSIFSAKYSDADYYFGSLRKWAGFYTGGFAWGNWKKENAIPPCSAEYAALRKLAMQKKADYISGKTGIKDYLDIFAAAEEMLDTFGICGAAERDIEAAKYFDLELVKSKRIENAQVLTEHGFGQFNFASGDCPLFVTDNFENRDALRKHLIGKQIYCPVHWPNNDLNGKELSLVCDQRYDKEEMLRICEAIEEFYA